MNEEAIITFKIKAVVRKGTTIEDLLENQTDYIFEPKSAKGCVLEHKIIDIKKV